MNAMDEHHPSATRHRTATSNEHVPGSGIGNATTIVMPNDVGHVGDEMVNVIGRRSKRIPATDQDALSPSTEVQGLLRDK